MKISITIDILPSEVLALIKALRDEPAVPSAPLPADIVEDLTAQDIKAVRVHGGEINRTNPFWEKRIGQIGRVVDERGGMWDVHFADDPFPCKDVDPQRFMSLKA
jgi:hypothetical protein